MADRVRVLRKGKMGLTLKHRFAQERRNVRVRHMAEGEADRAFRRELQSLKDKMDLFGEDSLSPEEREVVAARQAFFYPGRRQPGQLA